MPMESPRAGCLCIPPTQLRPQSPGGPFALSPLHSLPGNSRNGGVARGSAQAVNKATVSRACLPVSAGHRAWQWPQAESEVHKLSGPESEDTTGPQGVASEDGKGFAKQILCPLPAPGSLRVRPHSAATLPCLLEVASAMLCPAVLGLSLWALLHLGTGAPLCLSQQLRMKGDYVLGGLFPLGEAEEAGLGSRTRPSSPVCTRYGGGTAQVGVRVTRPAVLLSWG